ncbi:MAG: DUF2723 domain-containing protein [bacterium]
MAKEYLYRALAFATPLVLYLFTAAPKLYWEDSAAFQLAVSELGIPHNPSFPLYLLLAKLISLAPLGGTALMVTATSALFGAASALLVYLLAQEVGELVAPGNYWTSTLALLAALLFATVEAVWLQAVRAEVYTLNAFMTLLFFWVVLRYVQAKLSTYRFAALAGLLLGLGLANHPLLMGVVALPLLGVAFWQRRATMFALRPILLAAAFLALGLSVYFYLPIRAAQMPALNWGDFSSIGGTIKSLLRLDETLPVATAAVSTPFAARLWSNLNHVIHSVGGFVLLLGAVGSGCLWQRSRLTAILCIIPGVMSILTTAYAAEFSVYNLDLGGYLIPAFAALMIMIPIAPLELGQRLNNFMKERTWLRLTWIAPVCVLLSVGLLTQTSASLRHADKHELSAASDYAGELLRTLPPDALILAGEDNTFLPLLAAQQMEQLRQDVTVLSGGALLRSDYRHKTKLRFPELWYPADWNDRSFANAFPLRLQQWLEANAARRPVYLTISEWTAPLMAHLRPHLLAYSLEPGEGYTSQAEALTQRYWFSHLPEWQACHDLTTREHFARLLYNHGVYLFTQGQGRYAGEYASGAARLDKDNVTLLINCIKLLAATDRWSEGLELTRVLNRLEPGNEFVLTWLPRFEETVAMGGAGG